MWGTLRRLGLRGGDIIVVSKARVPPLEERPKRAVQAPRPDLEQQMRPTRRPLHLLALGETFADHRIHRRFDEG